MATPAPPETPLWSARRVPQPIVDAVGATRLQLALAANSVGTTACYLVDAAGAGEVAAGAPDAPRVPASTQKLLTAVAVIALLGPDLAYRTRAVAPSPPRGGAIDRLWVVGSGDPLVVTPEGSARRDVVPETRGLPRTPLTSLADAIVAAGVRSIPGGVIGDDSRFSTPRALPVWPARFLTENEIGPLGSLSVDGGFGMVGGRVTPAPDPAVLAVDALTRLLQARGVAVGAPPARGTAPEGATEIATLVSPPLRDVVTEMLSASDNYTAELLTLELGQHTQGKGTTAAGLQAVTAELTQLGVPLTGITLVDGSGLSPQDRVTCRALVAVLALTRRPELRAVADGLAIAGQRGTLVRRLVGTALQGRLRAKTGTLSGVAALAGLVDVGRPMSMAVLFNGPFTQAAGMDREDRAAVAMAAFPDALPADRLVPPPTPGRARRSGR